MAVSIASDTPWLGRFPVDEAGPVLMFVGEGGKRNVVRRVRGLAESRGIRADDLAIGICVRAPHLGDVSHLDIIAARIRLTRPKLVIIDPLCLSARGTSLADLYGMGAMLEAIQRIRQRFNASLLVVTHFNRKDGKGAGRLRARGRPSGAVC